MKLASNSENNNNRKFEVTISTINWNTSDQLITCIDSVLKHCQDINFQWFIMDNNSPDDNFDEVINKYSRYKNIIFIKYKKNLGRIAENHILKKIKSPYLLFLQPDVILINNAIRELINFMNKHQFVGGCSAKILNPDGSFQYFIRRTHNITNYFYCQTYFGKKIDSLLLGNKRAINFYYLDLDYDHNCEIEQVGLVSFIVRRKILLEDGFVHDPSFIILYYDDVDLCRRILKKGYKIFQISNAEVYHYASSSFKKRKMRGWFTRNYYRAQINYIRKYYKQKVWFLKFLLIIDMFILMIRKQKINIRNLIEFISQVFRY